MVLKIFWTDFAKSELQNIFNFYKNNVGQNFALKETSKIVNATIRLKKQPQIGQVEELLKDRVNEFRYLVFQSYKIIYTINWEQNQIEIIDVFHTKQYPNKIGRFQ